jgi:DNA-binding ferritin-like protein
MGPIATGARIAAHTHPGSTNLTKSKIDLDRIVQELMDGELSKAQRIKRLRELAKSGDEVPEELMDEALRKLMERITE